jgi:probable F420-dependent oxidoreductase
VKIGLFLPTFGAGNRPEFLRALAETAEQVGVASLWAPEHVVLVDAYESQYPYADDGRFPLDPSAGGLGDPFTVLSFLAAVTKTVRLGTGICLVPQRNPVYTAKMVAGLDVLSNGRVSFGVGIGWLKEEFDALEVPFDRRAQRTRAYLEIMRRLWTQDEASYADEFYTLPPVHMAPKPAQQPHPPIIFGGESDPALRRVADIGQGWFGWNLTPEMTAERLAALDRLLARRGRSRTDVSITISPYTQPARDLDAMKRYRDLGVGEVVHLLPISETPDQVRAAVEWLGEHIIVPAERL